MKIVIPTNRPDKVKTPKFLPNAELFINDFNNLARARNAILDKYADEDIILMMDDDLESIRQKNGEKVDVDKMVEHHLEIMKKYNFAFLGVGTPLQAFRNKKDLKIFARIFSVFYIDVQKFKKHNLRFDETINNFEDWDMNLQVFQAGMMSAVDYIYTMDFDHWAAGGCNKYRDNDFQERTTNMFIEKWKKYGKFVHKIYNPSSKMCEPRVEYQKLLKYVRG
jgi:hypothetical protein